MAWPSSHQLCLLRASFNCAGRRPVAHALIALLACSMLSGCLKLRSGPRPQPPALPEPLQVSYVTNRDVAPNDPKKCDPVEARDQVLRYATTPAPDGRLSFGIYEVVIGKGWDIGAVPDGVKRDVQCKIPPGKKKAIKALSVERPTPMPEADFFAELMEKVSVSPRREMLVFVHGFNFSLDEAAERAGQLKYDLDFSGPVVIYSWPSHESARKYREDEQNLEASVETLARVLDQLHERARPVRIHVIAHSLGARGLAKAVERLAASSQATQPWLGQIVLAAPDMGRDELRAAAPALGKMAERVTLYVSTVDRALLYGRRFHKEDPPRAGEGGKGIVVLPGMDTVDVTAVSESFIGHNYYGISRSVLSDIHQILHYNTPPTVRFGMFRVETPEGNYWAFRKSNAK